MPSWKKKWKVDELKVEYEHRLVNSVRHIYHPVPPKCRRAYPMCKVNVTTDLGSTEIEVGDSVIYRGKQLRNPETFDYSSIPPGETVHHIQRVRGVARTKQTLRHSYAQRQSQLTTQDNSADVTGGCVKERNGHPESDNENTSRSDKMTSTNQNTNVNPKL